MRGSSPVSRGQGGRRVGQIAVYCTHHEIGAKIVLSVYSLRNRPSGSSFSHMFLNSLNLGYRCASSLLVNLWAFGNTKYEDSVDLVRG